MKIQYKENVKYGFRNKIDRCKEELKLFLFISIFLPPILLFFKTTISSYFTKFYQPREWEGGENHFEKLQFISII